MPKLVDHARRRAGLADAAADVIAGAGLDAAGLRDVARASALTTGAVTHYFASKAALLDAAYDAVMARMLARQADEFDVPAPLSAQLDMVAGFLPLDAERARDWRVWLAFSARALVDPALQARHRRYYATITARLAADLAAAGAPAAASAADLLVAIVDGLGVRLLLEPDDWPLARVMAVLATAAPVVAAPQSPATPVETER